MLLLFPSYWQLMVMFLAAALCVLVALWLSKRRAGDENRMRLPAADDPTSQHFYSDCVIPLLVYEKRFPSFAAILSRVLAEFPLAHFTPNQEFRTAVLFLRDAAFREWNHAAIVSGMSSVIHCFVTDPEVEYRLREELRILVDQFLREIQD